MNSTALKNLKVHRQKIDILPKVIYNIKKERKKERKKKDGIEVFDYEISIICKNEEIRQAKVSRKEVLWNGIQHFQVIYRNITEQRNAEEKLRKLSRTVEQSPNAICITDPDGIIEYVNPRTIKLSGYSTEELEGQKTNIFSSNEKSKEEYAQLWQTIKLGNVWSGELHNKKKNGELYWESTTISPIFDNQGRITHFLSIKEDVTEQKLVEQALIQSEENFRRSISESPIGIRIVTVDGETIYANKVFFDMYEFNSLEEFTSTPVINRYTPESYAQHQERKEKRKNGHNTFDYEISIICKTAGIRYVKVSRKEIQWNGIKHYQVINFDITEQKKLTIELVIAKEKAEESDRLKSAFLANMSHEIRTPMNGILGFADLLKEPNLTGKKQQEYIKIIEKSGVRMLNIINDIVNISKIESGLMEVHLEESNINEQIDFNGVSDHYP